MAAINTAQGSSRPGTALAHNILEQGLWSPGAAQVVLFEGGAGSAAGAEALLEVLAEICRGDPEAHCLLLCERRRLRGGEFRQSVKSVGVPKMPDEAFRRVHVKYVAPPAAVGDVPPVVDLLANMQNLTFQPAAIAVFGLAELTRCDLKRPAGAGATAARGHAGECPFPADPAACYLRPALIGVAAADAQFYALAATLLVDAAAQASTKGERRCSALLWDDAPASPGSGSVAPQAAAVSAKSVPSAASTAQLSLLGSIFDAVWSVHWQAAYADDQCVSMQACVSPLCGVLPRRSSCIPIAC